MVMLRPSLDVPLAVTFFKDVDVADVDDVDGGDGGGGSGSGGNEDDNDVAVTIDSVDVAVVEDDDDDDAEAADDDGDAEVADVDDDEDVVEDGDVDDDTVLDKVDDAVDNGVANVDDANDGNDDTAAVAVVVDVDVVSAKNVFINISVRLETLPLITSCDGRLSGCKFNNIVLTVPSLATLRDVMSSSLDKVFGSLLSLLEEPVCDIFFFDEFSSL